MPALCRDCEAWFEQGGRCPACRSPRILHHDELASLSVAHMDCDAFYAAVEKRDNPAIRDRPVIVGGGKRGVVSTACYIARIHGVRSAMPMFKALKLCPDAVVIRPRMHAYAEASKRIQEMMLELTPDVEPLSLDEAFLDLSGTRKLHGAPPAVLLARLVNRMEREIGLTGSVGLSHNKFLAKVASDLDKPRGFAVIGRAETETFLADKPVGLIWGVGAVMRKRLGAAGIRTFDDLRTWPAEDLAARFGEMGSRLWRLSHGEDSRPVTNRRRTKSLSNETTFERDIADPGALDGCLWRLSVRLADRAKDKGTEGRVVTLKLRQRDFRLITRRRTLEAPTYLADRIHRTAHGLLRNELGKAPFRLIGVGISDLSRADEGGGSYLDPDASRRMAAETASDRLRRRFGKNIIFKGRSLR